MQRSFRRTQKYILFVRWFSNQKTEFPDSNTNIDESKIASVAQTSVRGRSKSALDKYCRHLTHEARLGLLDPMLGRQEILNRMVQILLRRTKNNPVLVGEPGVGKTAIVEGLANLIATECAPRGLAGKRVYSVNVGSLVAGTQYRGAFEERVQGLLENVRQSRGQILLFIDEIHMLVGAGAVEGSMDAGNLLKPALARGELHCIGATTTEEYQKHIEKEAALARRFQVVHVPEMTESETMECLRGLRTRYESFHSLQYTDDALIAATKSAKRYVFGRYLPDSAIDLMDEAAAFKKMQIIGVGEEQGDVVQFDNNYSQVKAAPERMDDLHSATLDEFAIMSDPMLQHKPCPHCGKPVQPQSGEKLLTCCLCGTKFLNIPPEKLMLGASVLHDKQEQLKLYQIQTKEHEEKLKEAAMVEKMLKEAEEEEEQSNAVVVDAQDVMQVVSLATGIPAGHLLTSELQNVVGLADRLKQNIYGQDEVIVQLSDSLFSSLIRSQAVFQRPKAAFFVVGPTGVGKTTLCKQFAQDVLGESQQHALVILDMSQMSEKHSMSRLVGAPPGYVGYGTGGILTDPVKRCPHSILLLENVNCAHSDVIDLIATMMEQGEITDATGKPINFSHTIVLLTTTMTEDKVNQQINQQHLDSASTSETRQEAEQSGGAVGASIESSSAPRPIKQLPQKLVERVDNVLVLKTLSRDAYAQIVKHHINSVRDEFQQQGINLIMSDEAMNKLLQIGVRPSGHGVDRMIRQRITVPVGKAIVNCGYADVLTQVDGRIQVQAVYNADDDIQVTVCDLEE